MSSESVVDNLSFSEEHEDHPPSKRIKLNSSEENPSPNRPNLPLNIDKNDKAPPQQQAKNDGVDMFDPVQAILDAGRKCQEEEAERQRQVANKLEETKGNNNNMEPEDDLASLEDSESESEDDNEGGGEGKTCSKKRDRSGGKGKSGKKKRSNMRRNIKDILKPEQLDDLTIAARKEEEERIQRIQYKQQQLKLLRLQQQQSQLLRESLSVPINQGTQPDFVNSRFADDLMRRLIQKKHITVSLDQSGIPQQQQQQPIVQRSRVEDDDCILLSSDEEGDSNNQSKSRSFPSHIQNLLDKPINEVRERRKHPSIAGGANDDVIALSSGDEEDTLNSDGIPLKDARLYEGVSGIGGRGVQVESDDDCVIISPDPDGEDEEDDKDECSQDLLNVPDNQGRVLVNVGHPDEDIDVFLPSQIARIVKPHQIGGIRFLYDNVVESKDRYKDTSGFGCILAHAMGLGKTLQTVSFCDVLLKTVGKTVLIIVPINTIQNWLNEFNRYLPSKDSDGPMVNDFASKKKYPKTKSGKRDELEGQLQQNGSIKSQENLVPDGTMEDLLLKSSTETTTDSFNPERNQFPESSQENSPACSSTLSSSLSQQPQSVNSGKAEASTADIQYRNFEIYLLNETVKSLQAREKTIKTWTEKGGVLLIGYEMYRMLALKKLKKSSRKAMTLLHEEVVAEAESLHNIYECLVDPGPDCVICDEGHRIKNSGAGISQALKAIKTKRRVVLTGYPLQNNLMEYWCMVDFVRPNYLGTKAEFSNMFERPIQNGQCADSTYEDKRLMKYRSHVLHSLLEGFVQRRSHVVLRNALPHKEEFVFLVRLTPIQLKIYKEFIRYLRDDLESDNASANPIKAFAVCCKIWNHPDVLWNVVKKNLDLELDLDIEEVRPVASRSKLRKGTGRPRGRPPLNGLSMPRSSSRGENDIFDDCLLSLEDTPAPKNETSGISLEWAKPLFENYTPEVMEHGVKFEILFELIDETVAVGDKLLVFSQSLLTLDLIEVFLKKRLNWRKHFDYVRLDGSTAGLEREKIINEFNKSLVQKLFLISTRAGSLGINLVGANRVCIFDASWNPCHDSQAVCRVYRYGQTKSCHIYRFVADCTLEKRIYDRQVNKKGMADRIVDEMNPNTPFKSKDVSSFLVLQHDLLEKLPYIKCDLNIDQFPDPVMQNVLKRAGDKITQAPFEHESLLIDQKHQRLSKSEKRLALKNYEKEKQTVANAYATYSRPSYAQYYSSIGAAGSSSPSASSYPTMSTSSLMSKSSYNDHRPYSSQSKSAINSSSLMSSKSAECFSGSMGNISFDRFELHINALKSRGISVFPVQLHQDTYLNDPSGSSDLYIRAGERVFILVSQKGTYLRVQGKLLRVPFVGTEMNQEQAELFVMSLLQLPSASKDGGGGSGRRSNHPSYPAEQQLPPSNNLLYQKNANHLQITNSRNTSGGDVMMGTSTRCSNGTSSSISGDKSAGQNQPSTSPGGGLDLSFMNDTYSASSYQQQTQHGIKMNTSSTSGMILNSSQSDLQSLSRLAETFCHRSSPYPTAETGNNGKQWSPSPSSSSTSKYDSVATPPVDLEVIKLNRSHSHSSNSNSSNSSSSRTNSPYTRQTWSNLSNDSTNAWGNNKDPSFYTDFTITPLSRNNINASSSPSSLSSRHSAHQVATASSVALDNFASGGVIQVPGSCAYNLNSFNDLYRSTPPSASPHQQQQQRQVQDSPFQGFGSTNTFETQSPMDLSPIMTNIESSPSPNVNLMPRDEQQQSFQDIASSLAETSRF